MKKVSIIVEKKDPGRRGSGIKGVLSNWLGRGRHTRWKPESGASFIIKTTPTTGKGGRRVHSCAITRRKQNKKNNETCSSLDPYREEWLVLNTLGKMAGLAAITRSKCLQPESYKG